jgi:hypothetical protein
MSGTSGNSSSYNPVISGDGRYVAFLSDASNLVGSGIDTNGTTDVYVRDLVNGTTTLVSATTSGASGNKSSSSPVISSDGRYVAFLSGASNLVGSGIDTNGTLDVFVRDLVNGTTSLISISTAGTSGNQASYNSVISSDGRYVAFYSNASNLVGNGIDTNATTDVFVRDLVNGTTTLVSATMSGASGNNSSSSPVISGDGRHVAFTSSASNLVGNGLDNNSTNDVFVRDLVNATTTLVSATTSGTSGNSPSNYPVISGDGRYVAFISYASNFVDNDTNGTINDLFVRDLVGQTTTLMSAAAGGANNHSSNLVFVSDNGQSVVFHSAASNLVGPDYNRTTDLFVGRRVATESAKAKDGTLIIQQTTDPEDPTRTALFITGTFDSDVLEITSGAGSGDLAVTFNGVIVGNLFHPTGHVYVSGRGGHDEITVRATGPLGIFVDGDYDSDTVTVFLGELVGPVSVTDSGLDKVGRGDDSLIVNGTPQDDLIVKTSNQVTLGNPVTETIDYSGIENVVVNGGEGNDTIDDPGSDTVILGGPGDDTYLITATFGNGVIIEDHQGATAVTAYLAELAGPLTVDVAGSLEPVTVQVIGTDQPDQMQLTQGNLSSSAGALINFNGPVTSLVVDGAGGDDSVAVESSSAQDLVLTDAEGSNIYTIQLGALAGTVTVADSTATNQVTIQGTDQDDLFMVGNGQVSSGDQVVNLSSGVQSVTIDAGGGEDQVIVEDQDPSIPPISVVGANVVPTAVSDNFATLEDQSLTSNVLANDSDADEGDVLTVVAFNESDSSVGLPVATQHGTVVLNADGSFSYTPGVGIEADTDSFTYTVSDGHGGSATASVTIDIKYHPRVAIDAAVQTYVFAVGTPMTFSGVFSHAEMLDPSATVWTFTHIVGTQTTTESRPATVLATNGAGTVVDNFVFDNDATHQDGPGVYTVTLTVTDSETGATTSEANTFVVYDPSEGFVTGGGWIDSPAGAYPADPLLTGKATFGFVSKYQKGSNIPTGQTEFQFKVADLNFHSSSYQWLVVAGARAQYKGTGTINGQGNYGFLLTVIDGQINGGGGIDKFRIKIWDQTSGMVVYDNQLEAGDDATPSTALGGGQVVIHKSGKALTGVATEDIAAGQSLTQSMLDAALVEARAAWAAAGISSKRLAKLDQLQVQMAQLPGSTLGQASTSTDLIWMDVDGAGLGWSVDGSGDGYDLVAAVYHELGHKLGLDHNVLDEVLAAGEVDLAGDYFGGEAHGYDSAVRGQVPPVLKIKPKSSPLRPAVLRTQRAQQ